MKTKKGRVRWPWAPPHPEPSKTKQKNKTSKKGQQCWEKKQAFLTHLQSYSTKYTTKERQKQDHKTHKNTQTTHNHPKPNMQKTPQLKTPFFMLNTLHCFREFSAFWNLHPSSAIAVFCCCEKHYKSRAFSKTQLLWIWITDSKQPFTDPFQKLPFCQKPSVRWNPFFVVFSASKNPANAWFCQNR